MGAEYRWLDFLQGEKNTLQSKWRFLFKQYVTNERF